MGTETIRQACYNCNKSVIRYYGPRYLNRRLAEDELRDIEGKYAAKGFPGCIGEVDYWKFLWKNWPRAHKWQYPTPRDGKLAVISAEAWCDHDLYIWHWFGGQPGKNNDLKNLSTSPFFNDILSSASDFNLQNPFKFFGGTSAALHRSVPYFLADGIYPP